ncbi:hypothetical protein [Haliea sp. E17]|uniref:hypothetical protein n=1 Tax=Haliea sp. E17 TaxID=3401576 RepID=UPI003AACD0D2
MSDSDQRLPTDGVAGTGGPISIVQRGNLKTLEQTLRKQWRLGQNIVLCWSADPRGLLVIFVPHYFLGNYCADDAEHRGNEQYIRELVSGGRRMQRDELFAVSERLGVAPTFIKLSTALVEEARLLAEVDQLIRRYGISYVDERAVLLFDIVEFSLFTPFEQASQLNSLSYSLNSAYNKLLDRGIEINFARTTTGDGYYVWNRRVSAEADIHLFYFMVLVIADNAVARAQSRGNTVPVIRTGFHIGGHYELYQAEGVNPTVFSYIVGDVTIELARMVDIAKASQVLVGEFTTPGSGAVRALNSMTSDAFVAACSQGLEVLVGTQLSGKTVLAVHCALTCQRNDAGESVPRRFRVVDKHGINHMVYNLELEIELEGEQKLRLGLDGGALPGARDGEAVAAVVGEIPGDSAEPAPAAPAEEMFDDLANLLQRRRSGRIAED